MAKRTTASKAPAGAAPAAPAAAPAPAPTAAADASAAPETAQREPSGSLTHVTVRSVRPNGRRRAGQAFGSDPLELHVSDATFELLQGDPQLLVEVV